MTALKFVSLHADRGRLMPHFGHVPLDADPASPFLTTTAGDGDSVDVRAMLRSDVYAEPDWLEIQKLMSAVGSASQQLIEMSSLWRAVAPTPTPKSLLYFMHSMRRSRTELLHGLDARANVDTWLRWAEAEDVLIQLKVPVLKIHRNLVSQDSDALRELLAKLAEALPHASPSVTPGDSDRLPLSTPAAVEAQRRAIAGWLDAYQAGSRIPGPSKAPDQRASRLRRLGKLLAVWVPEEGGFRFAPWQFDGAGNPHPRMAEVLTVLRGETGVAAGQPTSGWEELEWFLAPHALINGARPAELFVRDPDAVLALAREDFAPENANAGW